VAQPSGALARSSGHSGDWLWHVFNTDWRESRPLRFRATAVAPLRFKGKWTIGFGRNRVLPLIHRKTDKGLPQYDDAAETDAFILAGAEDLVRGLV
jgi:hypothetical protein